MRLARQWGVALRGRGSQFEVLVTTDQNLRYQQNLTKRQIAIVVIASASWPRIRKRLTAVVDAIERIEPGSYVEVTIP